MLEQGCQYADHSDSRHTSAAAHRGAASLALFEELWVGAKRNSRNAAGSAADPDRNGKIAMVVEIGGLILAGFIILIGIGFAIYA